MSIDNTIDGNNKSGRKEIMNNAELEKSMAHIIVEIIEYMANAVVIKTIIRKSTGNISVMSFDSGEGLTEKTTPFDTFVQIIDGKAAIVIDKKESVPIRAVNDTLPMNHARLFIAGEVINGKTPNDALVVIDSNQYRFRL